MILTEQCDFLDKAAQCVGRRADFIMDTLNWVLCEAIFEKVNLIPEEARALLIHPDARSKFRKHCAQVLGQALATPDVEALFERMKLEAGEKWRQPIPLETRLALALRQPSVCAKCGKSSADIPLEIDHKLPVARGGKSVINNLQYLCRDCNRKKGKRLEAGKPWLTLR